MSEQGQFREWTKAPRRFFVETITGILVFIIIAAAAAGISYLIVCFEGNGVDKNIVIGLKVAEYGVFSMDLILFGRFLWVTGKKHWKEL